MSSILTTKKSKHVNSIIDWLEYLECNISMLKPNRFDMKHVKELIDESNAPLRILIVGEFKAGKSTFINALLGEDLLTSDILPATAKQTIIKYGSTKNAWVVFENGSKKKIEINQIGDFTTETGNISNSKRQEINHVIIEYPNELLKSIEIIDSPGLTAIHKEHTQVTEKLLENAQVIFWIFHLHNIGTKIEIGYIKMLKDLPVKLFGIVNAIDRINPFDDEDIDEIIDINKVKFGKYFDDLIGISALQALNGKISKDYELLEESNWSLVDQMISDLYTNPQFKNELVFDKFIRLLKLETEERIRSLSVINEKLMVHEENGSLDSFVELAIETGNLAKTHDKIKKSILDQFFETVENTNNITNFDHFNEKLKILMQSRLIRLDLEANGIHGRLNYQNDNIKQRSLEIRQLVNSLNKSKHEIYFKNSFFSLETYHFFWRKRKVNRKYIKFNKLKNFFNKEARYFNGSINRLLLEVPFNIKENLHFEIKSLENSIKLNLNSINGEEGLNNKRKKQSVINEKKNSKEGYLLIKNDVSDYLEIKRWEAYIENLVNEISMEQSINSTNKELISLNHLLIQMKQNHIDILESNARVLINMEENYLKINSYLKSNGEFLEYEKNISINIPQQDNNLEELLPIEQGRLLGKYFIRNNIILLTIMSLAILNGYLFLGILNR